eukprot:scaffold9956_cov114-Isochrysis_galbana.AAC.4
MWRMCGSSGWLRGERVSPLTSRSTALSSRPEARAPTSYICRGALQHVLRANAHIHSHSPLGGSRGNRGHRMALQEKTTPRARGGVTMAPLQLPASAGAH